MIQHLYAHQSCLAATKEPLLCQQQFFSTLCVQCTHNTAPQGCTHAAHTRWISSITASPQPMNSLQQLMIADPSPSRCSQRVVHYHAQLFRQATQHKPQSILHGRKEPHSSAPMSWASPPAAKLAVKLAVNL